MAKAETYNDNIVRSFLLAAAVWGIVAMAIGVLAAATPGSRSGRWPRSPSGAGSW